MKRAETASETGEAIASFQSLPFVTPRGKYSVDLFKKFMRLHGKTYDFKIFFKSISTMFLLPKPQQQSYFFVISLETAIRAGKTAHSHLVFDFDKNDVVTKEQAIKLNMTE